MNIDLRAMAKQLLGPLTAKYPHRADELLDIYQAITHQNRPGRCVQCFFQLAECAGDEQLRLLRHWLEDHIEVVACQEDQKELDKFPLQLEDESLEALFSRISNTIRLDRHYLAPRIEVEFRYRDPAHAVG